MAFRERKPLPERKRVRGMGNRVLVVDDEKEIREVLFKALTRIAGFHVEVAENADEALQKIQKERFDLVLTDLKMPGKDGLQLLSEISKTDPDILTVMMTGHGTIDSALEAMKRGASDYLMKHLNLGEIIVLFKRFSMRDNDLSGLRTLPLNWIRQTRN